MLESVVTGGELRRALTIPGYRVAAKTGTAEVAEERRLHEGPGRLGRGHRAGRQPPIHRRVTFVKPRTMKTSARRGANLPSDHDAGPQDLPSHPVHNPDSRHRHPGEERGCIDCSDSSGSETGASVSQISRRASCPSSRLEYRGVARRGRDHRHHPPHHRGPPGRPLRRHAGYQTHGAGYARPAARRREPSPSSTDADGARSRPQTAACRS